MEKRRAGSNQLQSDCRVIPEAQQIIEEEEVHEQKLMLINEERLTTAHCLG